MWTKFVIRMINHSLRTFGHCADEGGGGGSYGHCYGDNKPQRSYGHCY